MLREGWGKSRGGIPALAKSMGRSVNAIRTKAVRLGLGPWMERDEYLTYNKLHFIVTGNRSSNDYYKKRWLQFGFPATYRRLINQKILCVRIEDFWEWAEKHQKNLDFYRFEENALGAEPAWAKEKRERDRQNHRLIHPKRCAWSEDEDIRLRYLIEHGATYADLERELSRSTYAIRRRIYDLYLPKPKRGKEIPWTDDDQRRLVRMIDQGYTVDVCARELGRSANSVRARVERIRKSGEWDRYRQGD